jgi:hypothetical protein
MKRTATLTAGLLLFMAVLAVASSVHLKGGPNAEPSFTDLVKILEASGALSGLGNGDVLISLTAQPTSRQPAQTKAGMQLRDRIRHPLPSPAAKQFPRVRSRTGPLLSMCSQMHPRVQFPARQTARTLTGPRPLMIFCSRQRL